MVDRRALIGASVLLAAASLGGCAGDESPTDPAGTATPTTQAAVTDPPGGATPTDAQGEPTRFDETATEPAATEPPTAEPTATAEATAAPKVVYELSPRQYLIRASLDLRGVRPSEAEYQQVEADPAAAQALAASFLDDPRFGARVRALFAPIFRTQLDFFPVPAEDYGLDDSAALFSSIGDEALRMASHIAVEDRPWTDLVTADWTMADEQLAAAWPIDYPEGASGWQESRYNDGRPRAGILSLNSLYWRYPSDGVNYNRGRANAVSRILLCNNYASRPVSFDTTLDLTDPELVNNALRTNTSCVNCHSSLDPLGSFLFGFHYVAKEDAHDASSYHPERERMWQSTNGVSPAYYGTPGYTLRDLGQQIAADPRFPQCAVEQVFEGLMDRPSRISDTASLNAHRQAFILGGLRMKALVRSVILDPRYCSSEGSAEGLIDMKVASPELMASQIEDLTGYRLKSSGYDLMLLDQLGLRSLAGGLDGITGSAPAKGATPTMALVHERLAQGAAWHVAQADAAAEAEARRLFTEVDFSETPEAAPQAMAAQVQLLHRRLFGVSVAADGPEVRAALDLWSDLYSARPSGVEAWAGVLSVLLRDPDFIFY